MFLNLFPKEELREEVRFFCACKRGVLQPKKLVEDRMGIINGTDASVLMIKLLHKIVPSFICYKLTMECLFVFPYTSWRTQSNHFCKTSHGIQAQ